MVQSITEKTSLISTETKVSDVFTTKDNTAFANALDAIQSKLGENAETSTMGCKEAEQDLSAEFKSACIGFSFCGKCGAMYRGTSVAKCGKCGHDMKEDNENAKKLSGDNNVEGASSAATASNTVQSTTKI